MNKYLIGLSFLIIFFACKKNKNEALPPGNNNPPVETKTTYTVDSASTQPGSLLTLTANRRITKDTCTVQLAGKTIVLAKFDSLHYAFFVPVLSPGTYTLDLKNLNAFNSPSITIRNYDVITNPDAVIAVVTSEYGRLADSLEKNSLFNKNAFDDAAFLRQLSLQFNEIFKQGTIEQKELIAYYSRNMRRNNDLFQQQTIDTSYIVSKMSCCEDEISVAQAASMNNFLIKQSEVILQVPVTLAAIYLAYGSPPEIGIPLAFIAVWEFSSKMKDLLESCESYSNTAFIGLDMDAIGTSQNPILADKNLPIFLRYWAKYRTLAKSDESGLIPVISNVIKAAYELEINDKSIKDMFDDLKSKFSSYFNNITNEYTAFVSPVLVTSKEKIAEVKAKFVSITNISNPNIVVTAIDDGLNGLKLTFSNPSNNITSSTDFTYQVSYTQEAINNKIVTTDYAKFIIPSVPSLSTTGFTSITSSSATSGGAISNDGGSAITVRGVCWSTNSNPTITNNKTNDGSGTGSFTSSLTGLTANTTYYVRAYATNSTGTAYGNEISFTTNTSLATLTTSNASTITSNSAKSGGDITSDGGSFIIARGVCWGTSHNPTTSNSQTIDGIGTGSFTSTLSGLASNTTYYVRAYAINSMGTAYGDEISFTTNTTLATITTTAASAITSNSASSGGNIANDGGATITARGVCWNTVQNPTIVNSKTNNGTGTGSFISSLSGLASNTTYYIRAYATNSAGTIYGNEVSFTTSASLATLTTTNVSTITSNSAKSGGNIVSDGGSFIIAKGICWSTSQNPTTSNNQTIDGTGTGTFISTVSGLASNTTYYVRAYATNSAGTAYGNEINFKTGFPIPSLTTRDVSNITLNTATSGGEITDDGGTLVTARGVCWSTSSTPTIANNKTNDGVGTGIFISSIFNLTPNTTYYLRAYATNSSGTAYGSQVSFTTGASLATLTTTNASTIAISSAVSGGIISSDGGYLVTARGVCWSTAHNPTISNSKTSNGIGTGAFTSYITGLITNTTYYARAYAINSTGTAYGNEISFTTNSSVPTLTTLNAVNITSNSASSGGNITIEGGSYITSRGVCWSTTQNPTISNNKTNDGTGTGTFYSSITGLSANTTYYVRAYATNNSGTAYGDQISFTASGSSQDLTIDSKSPWINSGISIVNGKIYSIIQISGGWSVDKNNYPLVSAEGHINENITDLVNYFSIKTFSGAYFGALLGKVGSNIFKIGANFSGTIPYNGTLYLQINDEARGDNGGDVTVRITEK